MVVIRDAATPRLTRKFLAALALRSPSPRLYSSLPRSSQWPSIVILMLGCSLRKLASDVSACVASGRISDLLKSKKASLMFCSNNVSSETAGAGVGAGGGGGLVTVTRAVDVAVPPGPVAVKV